LVSLLSQLSGLPGRCRSVGASLLAALLLALVLPLPPGLPTASPAQAQIL
jgi:hypothetical protein